MSESATSRTMKGLISALYQIASPHELSIPHKGILTIIISDFYSAVSDDESLFPSSPSAKDTTIWTAAAEGNLKQVNFFVEAGHPVDEPDITGGAITALVIAALGRHASVCQYLLRRGANAYKTRLAISALEKAIRNEDLEIVRLFLDWHAELAANISHLANRCSALRIAIMIGNLELFETLLGYFRQNLNLTDITSVINILRLRTTARDKALLRNTLCRITTQVSCLHRIVKELFPQLYDPVHQSPQLLPLHILERSHFHVLESLRSAVVLSYGSRGSRPNIHESCHKKRYFVAEFLLDLLHSQRLLERDSFGLTPLETLAFELEPIDEALPGRLVSLSLASWI